MVDKKKLEELKKDGSETWDKVPMNWRKPVLILGVVLLLGLLGFCQVTGTTTDDAMEAVGLGGSDN